MRVFLQYNHDGVNVLLDPVGALLAAMKILSEQAVVLRDMVPLGKRML